jgi:hypothetical protein
MKNMRWIAVLAASVLVFAAIAIEPPSQPAPGAPAKPESAKPEPTKAEPEPEPEAESGQAPAPAADPAAEEQEEELPPLPPDTEPVGPSPQRFNPTEKVRADFPVSFPIDI